MSDSREDKTFVQESKPGEGETSQNPKKRALEGDEDNQSSKLAKKTEFEQREEEDALPLSCPICKEPFFDPIVTKCNHYFCHYCALKVYDYSFIEFRQQCQNRLKQRASLLFS